MGRIILLNNMRRSLLLVWLSMAAFMGVLAQEVVATGICGAEGDGSNLTWTFTEDGTMTINGSGEMDNFSYGDKPWSIWEYDIKRVDVGEGVTTIGDYAFMYCRFITAVSLPSSVKLIGEQAFENCNFPSIELPESLDSIGGGAFSGNEALSSIGIPKGVRYISGSAFSNCRRLNSVVLCEGLKEIRYNAFAYCENLSSINIPNSVVYVDGSAFERCESLPVKDYVRYADTYLLGATDIYQSSYTIKEGTRFIAEGAFEDCALMSSIVIPNTVEQIGSRAFRKSGLISVELNSDIAMGYSVFEGCSAISSFSFLGDCTNVPDGICSGLKKLNEVKLGDKVVAIHGSAFSECKSLSSISMPKALTQIGYSAFSGCSSLTKVILPETMTRIGDYAFSGCSSLVSVNIPQSVAKIGVNAFSECTSLPVIDNVRYADTYLIGAVDTLKSTYKIKDGTRWIGSEAFYCCTEMKEITIPETVEAIGDQAFMGCASLDFISIPKSVRKIGHRAFGGDGVYIEDDDNYNDDIDDYIYIPCRLKSVVSLNTIPAYYEGHEINEYSDALFDQYTYFHAPLYVPEGSYWDYAYSPGWGEFTQIKEMAMDESALQSRQAYMIADAKGCNYTVYDADKGELVNVEYTHSLDEESEGSCWTVLKDGGKSFLYNIGAKKFASMDKDGKLTLSDAPVNMNIAATENGLSINGKSCMFVLNKNIEVDATGIESVLDDTESAEKSEVYAIDGRRMDKAVRGINIVNGNKVLVK